MCELAVVDVENPVHSGKGGITLGGVLDVDIDIHVHGYFFAYQCGCQFQDVAGGDVAVGEALDVDTGNLEVGDIFEAILAVGEVGKAGSLVKGALQDVASSERSASYSNCKKAYKSFFHNVRCLFVVCVQFAKVQNNIENCHKIDFFCIFAF